VIGDHLAVHSKLREYLMFIKICTSRENAHGYAHDGLKPSSRCGLQVRGL